MAEPTQSPLHQDDTRGLTGLTEAIGQTGPTEAAGPSGPSGLTAAAGQTGPTEAAGPSGLSGLAGLTEAAGPSGLTAASGLTESSGLTAAAGPTDTRGPTAAEPLSEGHAAAATAERRSTRVPSASLTGAGREGHAAAAMTEGGGTASTAGPGDPGARHTAAATAGGGGTRVPSAGDDTHRGGFGEFGGDGPGLIDRAFRERIVLVGVARSERDGGAVDASLDELSLLVDTAGADAVERVCQRRSAPDPATFVGTGKAREIRELAEEVDCDTVVFDDELSPAQQFNLEKLLGRTAIDRTAVILDIFAQNASTPEGKAQVELAQLRYRLPRLRGSGRRLSQQAGGIGTRGPGETQLEVDRRRLERRIHKLEADLRRITRHRQTQSKARSRARNRSVAIVGYTNAGKSSLLNRLTSADVAVEDRLFATLDPTTRRLSLPGGESVFLTDTVGFVRKLPHDLVEAFKTTLDVVRDADLLLHVVDGADADPDGSRAAVREVLDEIDAAQIPELVVFNKSDAGSGASRLAARTEGSVAVSALTGAGLDQLRHAIGDRLRTTALVIDLVVPWDRGDVLAGVHREGQVLDSLPTEAGMRLSARLDPSSVGALSRYIINTTNTAPSPDTAPGRNTP